MEKLIIEILLISCSFNHLKSTCSHPEIHKTSRLFCLQYTVAMEKLEMNASLLFLL